MTGQEVGGPTPDPEWALVLEEAPDALFLTDAERRIVWVNRAARELLGEEARAVIGTPFGDLFREPARMRSGPMTMRLGVPKSAKEIVADVAMRALADGRLIATVRDATERHRSREALSKSEQSFRSITESSPDGICAHVDGVIRYANPALARMLGYDSPTELLGMTPLELVHPGDRSQVRARVSTLVDAGETSVPFTEERLVKKDGSVVVASIGGLNVHFDGRPMVVAVCRDMTERRAQLTQMAQAERMAALGALSAGVAHEINNPLTYVILRLDIISSIAARAARLISELHPDAGEEPRTPRDRRKVELSGLVSDLSGHVSTAKEGANRVRTIVGNLRVFSRAESEPLMPVDIHGPLELALGLAHHELKQRATIHREFEADAFVMGTEGKLAQVFLQLLLNAAHAIGPGMPEKQHVSIRTRRRGDSVVVIIEDTGEGIPVENIPRVFEPFFTTRPPNAAMGLGLSMVHGIVTALGGTIAVEPREEGIPSSGTRFIVSLPRATPFIEDEHEDDRDEENDLYYRSRDA